MTPLLYFVLVVLLNGEYQYCLSVLLFEVLFSVIFTLMQFHSVNVFSLYMCSLS